MVMKIIESYMLTGVVVAAINLSYLLFGFYIGKLGSLSVTNAKEQVTEIAKLLGVSVNLALALSAVTQVVIDAFTWPRTLYIMIKNSSFKFTAKKDK